MSDPTSTKAATKRKALPEVTAQAIEGYPKDAQTALLAVRDLIYEIKNNDPDIGTLQEVLRWGELSFITEKPKTGSMIRLALTRSGEPALFFHCGTTLIESFRTQYSHIFEFETNRALVLRLPVNETVTELSHCIKQALRYKLDAKT